MKEMVEGNGFPVSLSSPRTVRLGGHRTRVLIGIHDLAFHQEVLDFLDRDPRVDVVGAASDPQAFIRLQSTAAPDVGLVCPVLARQARHPVAASRLGRVLVVAEEMTVPVLRDAIDVGAEGVFGWPEERDELGQVIASFPGQAAGAAQDRGRVIAVFGGRGGTGTTFVASHLAAAFADGGSRCVLVDLDASFADVTVALGIPAEQGIRTVADLLPVMSELAPEHVNDALYRHPRGFSVLLAPAESSSPPEIPAGLYSATAALLAGDFDVVVLHVPRALDETARSAIGMADKVLLVLALDLFSLYGARRAAAALGLGEGAQKCAVVINPLIRGDVSPRDVERVLGMPAYATVRFDSRVRRVFGRGGLLPRKQRRAGRDVLVMADRLAREMVSARGAEAKRRDA